MLIDLLAEAARGRGLLPSGQRPGPETLFALVRDIPYGRASSREPEAIVAEWRGTCSGKHYLLRALLAEVGQPARLVLCTHRFTSANSPHLPPGLQRVLADGPVPDVHTFLRLRVGGGWTDVDATWPRAASALGMVVNEAFRPGQDMTLACEPIERFEVPEGVDPQPFKESLIARHCGPDRARREAFIEGLAAWLARAMP